ncbi:hypothetical protein [Yoonia sp. R2-816]|uniref:hypothetical protein n=1 Tax=Yoonia sp. R2-816 TaxID=3342638 RepID=UPI00372ACF95
MPLPALGWIILGIGGIAGAGWVAHETGDAMDSATRLTKAATVAGGLYVSYQVLKTTGAIK